MILLSKDRLGAIGSIITSKLKKITIIPFHSKDIPQGTLRSIIKQSGLNEDRFLKK